MAEEARLISKKHQTWIVGALREVEGNALKYEVIVKLGETQHCDTVGAMLKVLKGKGVVSYNQQFLMYPMHKEEVITLVKLDYDPMTAE